MAPHPVLVRFEDDCFCGGCNGWFTPPMIDDKE